MLKFFSLGVLGPESLNPKPLNPKTLADKSEPDSLHGTARKAFQTDSPTRIPKTRTLKTLAP